MSELKRTLFYERHQAMGATLELDRPDEQSFRATITIASA